METDNAAGVKGADSEYLKQQQQQIDDSIIGPAPDGSGDVMQLRLGKVSHCLSGQAAAPGVHLCLLCHVEAPAPHPRLFLEGGRQEVVCCGRSSQLLPLFTEVILYDHEESC